MMLVIDLPENIRRAAQSDWRTIGAITGDAFQDDPLTKWIVPDTRAMTPIFTREARDIYLPNGVCHLCGNEGATQWLLPGADNAMPLAGQISAAWHLFRYGGFGALRRGLAAEATMEKHHPTEPHVYLYTVAVRPSAQGKGVGRSLLAPMLAGCDKAGMPVYLENTNPRNHPFYAAHGFEHVEHFEAGPGGPPLEAMWRKAR